jgi:hypothetical protein
MVRRGKISTFGAFTNEYRSIVLPDKGKKHEDLESFVILFVFALLVSACGPTPSIKTHRPGCLRSGALLPQWGTALKRPPPSRLQNRLPPKASSGLQCGAIRRAEHLAGDRQRLLGREPQCQGHRNPGLGHLLGQAATTMAA